MKKHLWFAAAAFLLFGCEPVAEASPNIARADTPPPALTYERLGKIDGCTIYRIRQRDSQRVLYLATGPSPYYQCALG